MWSVLTTFCGEAQWFDWTVLTFAITWGGIAAAGCAANLLASPLARIRVKYAAILHYLRADRGTPYEAVPELRSKLDRIDYGAEEWRKQLLLRLQEASEIARDNSMWNLVANRLGDAVRKTCEMLPPSGRRALIDAVKLTLAEFPEKKA